MAPTSETSATMITWMASFIQESGFRPPNALMNDDLTDEGFKSWKQRFEVYRKVSGARKMPEDVQVALLLHCMGDACVNIYNTFTLTEEEKTNYDKVLKTFEEHFVSVKDESAHLFFTRNQVQGESFDFYLTDLRKLIADCNIESLKDRLIRDQIITGILDNELKNQLRESDFSLQETIQICQEAEIAKQQVMQIETKAEIDAVNKESKRDNSTKSGKRRRKKKSSQQKKRGTSRSMATDQQDRETDQLCQQCGYIHAYINCPASKKICYNCRERGHFLKVCKRKQNVEVISSECDECSESEECYESTLGKGMEEYLMIINNMCTNPMKTISIWSSPTERMSFFYWKNELIFHTKTQITTSNQTIHYN